MEKLRLYYLIESSVSTIKIINKTCWWVSSVEFGIKQESEKN